jgi:phosphoglycerate dehydrogenase-like enzyme
VAKNYQDFADQIEVNTVVVEHNLSSEVLENATKLDWIQTLSSGADFYDLDRIEQIGAILTTVSGVHSRPIGEYVCTAMLYFEKRVSRWMNQHDSREWRRFSTGELGQQTVGIIGVGSIGGRVAELAQAFEMDVIGLRQTPSTTHSFVDEMYGPSERHELLGRSDYVVIACPLTAQTRGLIGRDELHSMDKDAVLINVARGEIVDQDALVEQLQMGYIGGAFLDVARTEPIPEDSPLWNLSNVIITPHMAGGSPRFADRCAKIFAENYEAFINGTPHSMINRVV